MKSVRPSPYLELFEKAGAKQIARRYQFAKEVCAACPDPKWIPALESVEREIMEKARPMSRNGAGTFFRALADAIENDSAALNEDEMRQLILLDRHQEFIRKHGVNPTAEQLKSYLREWRETHQTSPKYIELSLALENQRDDALKRTCGLMNLPLVDKTGGPKPRK